MTRFGAAGPLAIAMSAALAPVATQAQAQDNAAAQAAPAANAVPAGGLEEIVVTAQKRAQNVQDVPIAVSAFTASALQERAIGSVANLANITPNVTLDAGTPFSGSSAVLAAYIRGIGSDDFAFNIDPGVGIYVDGVYLARSVGANQDLLDIERIEVLKGPQGTLFGRNTIGGAISIVTRDPGKDFRLVGDVTTGSYNLVNVRAAADIPISSTLSAGISVAVKTRDGYLKRIPFPDARANNQPSYTGFPSAGFDTASREGADNDRVLRGKLKWRDGGPLSVTLAGDYTRSDTTGFANKLIATTTGVAGNFAGTANLPGTAFDPTGTTGFLFGGLYNFCIGATGDQIAARNAQAVCGARGTQFNTTLSLPSIASRNVDGNPRNDLLPFDDRFLVADKDKSYATGNSFSKLTSWGGALTLEYALSDAASLKSITAYRALHWKAGLDADGSPLNFLQLSFPLNQKQFSQEVQLTGNFLDRKLSYVFGAYYFKEKGDLRDYVTFAEGMLQVDGFNTFDTYNYAAFGQVDYRATDWLGFTVGGRYTRERKLFQGGQQDLNGFNYKLFGCGDANGNVFPNGPFPLAPITCQQGIGYPDPSNPIRVYAPGVNRQTFENFAPKLGVQLHPTEDIMAYGSWSRGYKTGGWTTRLTNPQPTAQSFAEETAETWELGVKSQLLDRRLQINAAAFTTRYDGIQLNFQQGTSPTIRNAGNARIKGFEVEATAAPGGGFTLSGSVGYIDAYYTTVLPGVLAVSGPNVFQAGTFAGAALPKTPKWKTNISPRYVTRLGNGASVTMIGDWTHTTRIWNDSQRTYALRRTPGDIVNASIAYQEPQGHWTLTAGGTNLLNDRFLTTANSNIAVGAFFGTYNRPAEWYLRLAVKI